MGITNDEMAVCTTTISTEEVEAIESPHLRQEGILVDAIVEQRSGKDQLKNLNAYTRFSLCQKKSQLRRAGLSKDVYKDDLLERVLHTFLKQFEQGDTKESILASCKEALGERSIADFENSPKYFEEWNRCDLQALSNLYDLLKNLRFKSVTTLIPCVSPKARFAFTISLIGTYETPRISKKNATPALYEVLSIEVRNRFEVSPKARKESKKLANYPRLLLVKEVLGKLSKSCKFSTVFLYGTKANPISAERDSFLIREEGKGVKDDCYMSLFYEELYAPDVALPETEVYKDEELAIRVISAWKDEKKDSKLRCFECHLRSYCKLAKISLVAEQGEERRKRRMKKVAYSDEQKEIFREIGGQKLVLSVPGSGKTTVVIGLLKEYIDKGIPAKEVVCLTFTNKARDEVLERVGVVGDEAKELVVSTIHGLAMDVLGEQEELFGETPSPLDETVRRRIVYEILRSNDILQGISYSNMIGSHSAVEQLTSLFDAYEEANEQDEVLQAYPAINKEQFVEMYRLFKDTIRQRGYLEHDDILTFLCDKLEANPTILAHYRNVFKYLLVDEYQDTNPQASRFIDLLVGKTGNLVVVGDDDQSIYRFRGGSNTFILSFKDRYPDAKVYFLSTNYRSAERLVSTSQEFIKKNTNRYKKEVNAKKKGRKEKSIFYLTDAEKDIDLYFCNQIDWCLKKGVALGEIAFLVPDNETAREVCQSFNKRGYPAEVIKSPLIDEPLFSYLHTMLNVCVKQDITNKSFYYLSVLLGEELSLSVFDKDDSKSYFKGLLKKNFPTISDFSFYFNEENEKAFKDDQDFMFLRHMSKAVELSLEDITGEEFAREMFAFLQPDNTAVVEEILTMMKGNVDFSSLEETLYMFDDMIKLRSMRFVQGINYHNCINVSTLHSAKGLEWDAVFISPVRKIGPKLPKGNREDFVPDKEDVEESRRLLYVAMTRARKYVFFIDAVQARDTHYHFAEELKQISDVVIPIGACHPNSEILENADTAFEEDLLAMASEEDAKEQARKKREQALSLFSVGALIGEPETLEEDAEYKKQEDEGCI